MGCHQIYLPLPLPSPPSSQFPTMDLDKNTFQHYCGSLQLVIPLQRLIWLWDWFSSHPNITSLPLIPPHVDFATEVLLLIQRCITSLPRHKHDVLIPSKNLNFLPHIQIQPLIDTFHLTHSHAPLNSPSIAISIIKRNFLVPWGMLSHFNGKVVVKPIHHMIHFFPYN